MLKKIKGLLFENKNSQQTIAKNSIWLSISNFGGRLIKAIIIIYAARVLGTAEYGVFSYALTLAGFLTLLMDPGLNGVLMRDSARASEDERRTIFSTIFIVKIPLLLIGVGVIAFIAPFFSTLPGAKALLPVVALIVLFDTLREFFLSFVRSIEKMEWEAGIFIFTNIAIVAFGFIFMWAHPTASALSVGYTIGTFLGLIAAVVVTWKRLRPSFSHFAPDLVMPIIRSAWPFAVAGVLGLLLTNTDILIISWMKTASDVGIYSAAIRIIQVLYIIPGVIQISALPLLSRLANRDNDTFRLALERMIGVLFLASIPMALGGAVLSTQIMSFVYGPAFAAGGIAFALLMITMIVDYPGSILSAAIFTYGHQKSLITASAIGGISNIVLDILLIPRFGMTGSAAGTLIAQTLGNAYLWYAMRKLNRFSVLPHLKKITAAGLIMFVTALGLSLLKVELLVIIGVCTILYFALLRWFREPLLVEAIAIFRK